MNNRVFSAYRKTAYVGRKFYLDVVDDIKQNGRAAFLGESHIDMRKGKAFDARLHRPVRYGDGTQDGPTGGLPAGGTGGRQSYRGVSSMPRAKRGITHDRVTTVNTYNQY